MTLMITEADESFCKEQGKIGWWWGGGGGGGEGGNCGTVLFLRKLCGVTASILE